MLLPGSRPGEAIRHMPDLLNTIPLLRTEFPLQVVLGTPKGFAKRAVLQRFRERMDALSIKVIEDDTWDVLAYADLALAASGTVTVEAAVLGTPMVTFYKVTALSWWAGRWLVKVPYLSMVNLIAGKAVVPELIQNDMTPETLAAAAAGLLREPRKSAQMRSELLALKRLLTGPLDPFAQAARMIATDLGYAILRPTGDNQFMRAVPWTIAFFALAVSAFAQDKAARVEVRHYLINADVNPRTQSISATAKVDVVALGTVDTAVFELNNALKISKVVDGKGQTLEATRDTQDSSVRVPLPSPLAKNQAASFTFTYEGQLTGGGDSPVYGITFAALKPDFGFLLYPARWFPVTGYSIDRYTADLHITAPTEYKVVGSGDEKVEPGSGGQTSYSLAYDQNPASREA